MTTVGHITGDTMKEETIKDLEEVYRKASAMNLLPTEHGEVNKLIVRAFQAGADWALFVAPLEGYSNLTAAIEDDKPIDWERLDELKVQCVNPDMGMLSGKLERNPACLPDVCGAWWDASMGYAYINALVDAWYGSKGWALYVEGDIPLIRKTADQLKVGHLFTGRKLNGGLREYPLCTASSEEDALILWAKDFSWTKLQARYWEVIADHGPFQNPVDK